MRPMIARTIMISRSVMPLSAARRMGSRLRLGVPAVDVVGRPVLLVGARRDHAELLALGRALVGPALHDIDVAPGVLQVLLVRVLEQVLELVGALGFVVG